MNDNREQPIVAVIFLLLAALAAWLTVKLWRWLRERSPGWDGPTLYCILIWCAVFGLLRKMGGN